MENFKISIAPASNGEYTVYIENDQYEFPFEFCGSISEVGEYIQRITVRCVLAAPVK